MKKTGSQLYLAFCFVVLSMFISANAIAGEKLLVKFKPGISETSAMDLFARAGLEKRRFFPEISLYGVEVADRSEFRRSRKFLGEHVEYIEKDIRVRMLAEPNDPLFSRQRHQRRNQMEKAWDISTGSYDIVVAISDTGYAKNHPDLRNQLWVNPGEIAGNNIDDDRNGFVDDVNGWNFVSKSPNVMDTHFHGSHVAGIIGAEGDNGVGIAGVNWRVKLMAIPFLDGENGGTLSDGIASILYAANNGARALNCSWGGEGGDSARAIKDAIDYGLSKGMLTIAAAGNSTTNIDHAVTFIPAAADSQGLITVASSHGAAWLSNFSNKGATRVHVTAPGFDIYSTVGSDDYSYLNGTSMAAPSVTGIAALILSKAPEMSPLDLRNAVLNAVDETPKYKNLIATSGDVNAHKALLQLSGGFQVWPARLTLRQNQEHKFTAHGAQGSVTWSVSPENAARVDAQGRVVAAKPGEFNVIAQDSSGQLASTTWVRVIKSEGGGGCAKSPQPMELPEAAGAMASLGLPFAFGFVAIRGLRRRRKVEDRDSI